MNAIFTIDVYKVGKTWYFDDESRNIQKEAFVLGASELITTLLGKKKRKGTISFSTQPIPNHDIFLTCTEKCHPYVKTGETKKVENPKTKKSYYTPVYIEDKTQPATSAWYVDENGESCWLCPAQLAFFGSVAETIYAKRIN